MAIHIRLLDLPCRNKKPTRSCRTHTSFSAYVCRLPLKIDAPFDLPASATQSIIRQMCSTNYLKHKWSARNGLCNCNQSTVDLLVEIIFFVGCLMRPIGEYTHLLRRPRNDSALFARRIIDRSLSIYISLASHKMIIAGVWRYGSDGVRRNLIALRQRGICVCLRCVLGMSMFVSRSSTSGVE